MSGWKSARAAVGTGDMADKPVTGGHMLVRGGGDQLYLEASVAKDKG
jgi:hypothetical protein